MPKTLEITVKGFHVDQYQHVNNARYLEFLEEARWYFLEEQFRSGTFKDRAWSLPITEINIKYRQGAYVGDDLIITTGLKAVRKVFYTVEQRITNKATGKLIALADVTFVVYDNNKKRPISLTDEVKAVLGMDKW